MANNSLNISIPVSFELRTPPRGMVDYDPKALSSEEQRELNTFKLNVRKKNIIYFADHPEVQALISMVVRMTAIHRPRNVIEFVAKLFTRPEREIREEVNKILKEPKTEYEPIPFCDYAKWDH